ncbi:hypothetical protein [Pararcticibacter amylolyticus]|nr:hypothetical protein [Pararcticibacter amylolyticus]
MKKLKFMSLFVAVCMLTFSSCKKDKDSEEQDAYLSVKVNGELKEARGATNVTATYNSGGSDVYLQLIANLGENKVVSFVIKEPAAGRFNLGSYDVLFIYSNVSDNSDSYIGSEGTPLTSHLLQTEK